MDFNIHGEFTIQLFGQEFWITETMYNTWIITAVLLIIGIVVRVKLSKFTDKPTGFQNVVEVIVESVDNFVISTMGSKYRYFGSWFFGVIAFILFSNLSGLFGLRPPTADLAVTMGLAMTTFVLIHGFGIFLSKGAYFKGYVEPVFIFFPINIIGEMATPVSLGFRLFGNILGGTIIMGMVYAALPGLLKIAIPVPLHAYFDAFAGILQTYIFVILSMTFIRDKLPE